jgi:hypothetical protein
MTARKARQPKASMTVIELNAAVREAHASISIQLPPGSGSHYYVPIAGTEPCKRCPFCGEGAYVDLIPAGSGWWARVQCQGCGVHGPESDGASEGEDDSIHGLIVEAARMWNTRKGGAK